MTRRILVATILVAATLPVLADGPGRIDGPRRLDYLAGYLGLSETQKAQAQTIFDAAETASETARGQLESARDALKTAVKANQPDSELDRLSAAVGVIHGQLTAIQAKASAKFYALLTADQKARYDALGERGHGRGPDRP